MRFATCLVAALLASTTLTTQIAAACGGYENVRRAPAVMTLTTHVDYSHSGTDAPKSTRRSFALTRASIDVTKDMAWERVAPHSYDGTAFALLPAATAPRTMTLVGPSGARVVRTDARVALLGAMFKPGAKFEAFELSIAQDEQFAIALAGSHTDAVWHKVNFTYSTTDGIDGTSLKATRAYVDHTSKVTLRDGSVELGTFDGSLVGAVDVGGARYVVLRTAGGMSYTVEVPADRA